ncbi:CrcB-like protein-domain-containing protein [Xylariales sp. PMI_506]|nr:CrcB-like protein-domain-containing protein [Xylariales sp. PMI_506]
MTQPSQSEGSLSLNEKRDLLLPTASDGLPVSETGPDMSRRLSVASKGSAARPPSVEYAIPESYANLDEAVGEAPVQNRDEGQLRRYSSREQRYAAAASPQAAGPPRSAGSHERPLSQVSRGSGSGRQRRLSSPRVDYDAPDAYVNVPDIVSTGPIQNPDEAALYKHESLEDSRSQDQDFLRERREERRRASRAAAEPELEGVEPAVGEKEDPGNLKVSKLATQVYTISYLILFSLFGTLARLGLQALTFYHGAPVMFSSVWPNFAGSLVMGFLSEDRMLFRYEWGTPTYEQQINKARQNQRDEESGGSNSAQAVVDLAAAKKAHMATKKTIPLYIGLATGFCGSFTSFSSFIRDVFLALANDMPNPDVASNVSRSGGYSFMALISVIITTVSLSIAGLFIGAHLAIALEPFTPSLPFLFTRKFVDRIAVFLAWGCWIGAILLCIVPPDRYTHPGAAETWRGRATFALVFAPLGCLGRFYASLYLNGRVASFPMGTFAVNMFGTAILGMSWDLAHIPLGGVVGCQVLQGIEDGFCGCLTTVSTWVTELVALRRRHAYTYGATSVVVALALMIAIMGGLQWSKGDASLLCLK